MKALTCSLLLLCLVNKCHSQINRDTIQTTGFFAGTRLTVETGMHIPFGKLAAILQPNMLFGVSMDIPQTNAPRHWFGLDAAVYLTNRSNPFLYRVKDSLLPAKISKTGFAGGIHFTGRTYLGEKYVLDKIAGIGMTILSTNIKKNNPQNNNDTYYTLSALHLNAGIALKRAISKNTRIGIRLVYNFTAYALCNKQVEKGFGTNSVTTSLSATF